MHTSDSVSLPTVYYRRDFILSVINGILLFLSLAAIVKSILTGFDIDESYAVTQAYRLIAGDTLLADMWEPHQTSAFGSAFFMLPFLWITGGNTTGIVIYLRIIGTIIHLLIGYWFYRTARKNFSANISILISLVHINFLPKWVTLPEFEIMHYWASCLIFLSLLAWYAEKSKCRYLLIAGSALWISIMTYPTMIILYPVYALVIFFLYPDTLRMKIKPVILFTLPLILMGLGLLLYLFSYMPFSEFMQNIRYVLMDDSHSAKLLTKYQGYLKELLNFGKQLLLYLPLMIFLTICIYATAYIRKLASKRLSLSLLPLLFLLSAVIVFSLLHIVQSLMGDVNQFFLYFRFLLITLLGIVAVLYCRIQSRKYLLLGILPGIMGVFASASITNMTFEIALARIYIAVMASAFILCTFIKENYSDHQIIKGACLGTSVLFILGLLVCKLLLLRVTGCIPVSIKMDLDLVTEGPAAGLLVDEDLAAQYNANIDIIQEYTHEDDNLLYFGCENIYYMVSDAEIASPSTQGTAVFNEMYLLYYEEYPEKLPNVVIIDKGFSTNPYYNYSSQNQIVLDWIMEEFADAEITETEYLIIMRSCESGQ